MSSGLDKLSGYLRNLFGIDVSGSNVDGIQHVTHWRFGDGFVAEVNETTKQATLNTQAFSGAAVVQSSGYGRRVHRRSTIGIDSIPTSVGYSASAMVQGVNDLEAGIVDGLGKIRLLKQGALDGDIIRLKCHFVAGDTLIVDNDTESTLVNETHDRYCERSYVFQFKTNGWIRFDTNVDEAVTSYRESMHVLGRALLPEITNAQIGCRVTCGSLGEEFIAVVAGTYPVDNEFVIASDGSPTIQWVWRNPVNGKLLFDPSDSPKWVCGVSAEHALLWHDAGGVINTTIPVDGALGQGDEVYMTNSSGSPTLSRTSFGGKPGITLDTSTWLSFALPARCQPGQGWGVLIATALQPAATTRNIVDLDNGSANDSGTVRIAVINGTATFGAFQLGATTQFNTAIDSGFSIDPYRGPSATRTARQTIGVFGDGGFSSYVDSKPVAEKVQPNLGSLNTGSATVWLNRQASGVCVGSQILHRIDLFSGHPGNDYLRNYDRYIHAGMTDKRVICIGDSITWGHGLTNAQSWPTLLGNDPALTSGGYSVENEGIRGWQTTNVLEALSKSIGPHVAFEGRVLNGKTVALVMVGINDCGVGKSSSVTTANLFEICDRLKACGAYVILSTLLPAGTGYLGSGGQAARNEVNAAILAHGSEHANAIFQGHLIANLADPTNATYYLDQLHPSENGALVYKTAIEPLVLATKKTGGKLFSVRRGGGTSSLTSTDGGNTWTTNASVITDANWYWIAYDPNYNRHVAVTNGSAYVAISATGGSTWTSNDNALKGATSFYRVVYDPSHACLVALSETGNVCNYSTDGGSTWTQVAMGITEHPWFPIDVDRKRGVIVAVSDGADNSTCRSIDGGRTWSAGGSINSIFSSTVCNVVCYDPDHERLVATNQTKKSAYSTDGGTTWAAGGNLPASRQWDSLAYDTTHKRMLAVSCSGTDRITAYSTDGGVTWTQGGTIPGIATSYFRQLVCDPVTGRVIGPLHGATPPVYIYTDDGGTTWGTLTATGSSSASGTAMGIVPY